MQQYVYSYHLNVTKLIPRSLHLVQISNWIQRTETATNQQVINELFRISLLGDCIASHFVSYKLYTPRINHNVWSQFSDKLFKNDTFTSSGL